MYLEAHDEDLPVSKPVPPKMADPIGKIQECQAAFASLEAKHGRTVAKLLAIVANVAYQFERDYKLWKKFAKHPFWNKAKRRPNSSKTTDKLPFCVQFFVGCPSRNHKTWKYERIIRYLDHLNVAIEDFVSKIDEFEGPENTYELALKHLPRRPKKADASEANGKAALDNTADGRAGRDDDDLDDLDDAALDAALHGKASPDAASDRPNSEPSRSGRRKLVVRARRKLLDEAEQLPCGRVWLLVEKVLKNGRPIFKAVRLAKTSRRARNLKAVRLGKTSRHATRSRGGARVVPSRPYYCHAASLKR